MKRSILLKMAATGAGVALILGSGLHPQTETQPGSQKTALPSSPKASEKEPRTKKVSRSKEREPTPPKAEKKAKAVKKVEKKSPKKPSTKNRPTGSWLALAKCESGANLTRNSGNGYYGAYQFSAQSWRGFTHGKFGPVLGANWSEQTFVAYRIWLKQGWGAYPGCGRKLGYPTMPAVAHP